MNKERFNLAAGLVFATGVLNPSHQAQADTDQKPIDQQQRQDTKIPLSYRVSFDQSDLESVLEENDSNPEGSSLGFLKAYLEHIQEHMGLATLQTSEQVGLLWQVMPQDELSKLDDFFNQTDIFNDFTDQINLDENFEENLSNLLPGTLLLLETPFSNQGINQVSTVALTVRNPLTQENEFFLPQRGTEVNQTTLVSAQDLVAVVYPEGFEPYDQGESTPEALRVVSIDAQAYIDTARSQIEANSGIAKHIKTVFFYGMPRSWGSLGFDLDGKPALTPEDSLATLQHYLGRIESVLLKDKMNIHVDLTYVHPTDTSTSLEEYNPLVEETMDVFSAWAQENGREMSFSINIKSDKDWTQEQITNSISSLYQGETPYLSTEAIETYSPSISFDPEYQVWTREFVGTGENSESRTQLSAEYLNRLAFVTIMERARSSGRIGVDLLTWPDVFEAFGTDSFWLHEIGSNGDGHVFDSENMLNFVSIVLANLNHGTTPEDLLDNKVDNVISYNQRLESMNEVAGVMIFAGNHLGAQQRENVPLEQSIEFLEASGTVDTVILQ